ncbi:SET domain-containing protein [Rhizoctonia solani AG-1 IA]|uniref:SET domain-containing protein n=1 Tax=Thanatephorus cucumeris (strain AG1-IA) TaxID=983506 RepID=L8WSW8_THACA|nr:SET domain-containing protein [Rhizoctonia solani AG-1 IA]
MSRLTGMSRTPTKTWTSVQCGPGPDDHLELNSVLVYANHSCLPNVIVDVSSNDSDEWHFRALRDISPGDNLTFFYPSTEWDMTQAFNCKCQEKVRMIRGARYLAYDEVEARGFINAHITRLMEEQDGAYETSSQSSD